MILALLILIKTARAPTTALCRNRRAREAHAHRAVEDGRIAGKKLLLWAGFRQWQESVVIGLKLQERRRNKEADEFRKAKRLQRVMMLWAFRAYSRRIMMLGAQRLRLARFRQCLAFWASFVRRRLAAARRKHDAELTRR
eukprot:337428-Prymnesium_polylepis.1